MNNFTFSHPTKVLFGKDSEKEVGKEIIQYGHKVLLVYGGGSIKKNGVYDKVIYYLKKEDIDIFELEGVKPNPRLDLVENGIEICRREDIHFILAVGGGSVIDTAKAIAIGTPYKGEVWDFFEGKARIEATLPVGSVLTIPAAGSECGDGTVITKDARKLACNSPYLIPKFAILNPEFSYTLPSYQIACGACDMFAHLLERYFTPTKYVDVTDHLLEAAMSCILDYSLLALKEPNNYNIRAELMWLGTIAHNNMLNMGREGDWASHEIEHELSAMYDIAHGEGLAIVIPAWMQYVYKENPARFLQLFQRVFHINISGCTKELAIQMGIQRVKMFFRDLGLATSLKEANISEDKLLEMSKRCCNKRSVGNFKSLNTEDIYEIFKLAY